MSRTMLAGDLGTFRGGSGFPVKHQGRNSGDLPFFKVSDMNSAGNELFMSRANNYVSESRRKSLGAVRIPAGAIVFAKVGAAVFQERKRILAQDSCIDNNLCAFIVNEHVIDVRFAHYLLTAFKMSDLVAVGALPSLNGGQLRSIPLLVPEELSNQRRIVAALKSADDLIETLEHLIAKKQAIKQGLMQQLLTGRTRLPGFEGDWERTKIGAISSMGSGGTPLSSVSRYYGGSIPWVSISDMTHGGKYINRTEKTLTEEGVASSAAKLYEPDVVLYAMYASIGECSLAVGRVASSQAILGIKTGPMLNREFLYYWLQYLKPRVKLLGQQGAQSNLNAGMVRDFVIQLPLPDEQAAVAGVLSDVDYEISALERRVEKARTIKTGMMQQLLTGRVRLPVAVAS